MGGITERGRGSAAGGTVTQATATAHKHAGKPCRELPSVLQTHRPRVWGTQCSRQRDQSGCSLPWQPGDILRPDASGNAQICQGQACQPDSAQSHRLWAPALAPGVPQSREAMPAAASPQRPVNTGSEMCSLHSPGAAHGPPSPCHLQPVPQTATPVQVVKLHLTGVEMETV